MVGLGGQRRTPVAGDGDMVLGAAPAMTPVIAHQTGAQRADGIVLQPRVQRGAHLQAAIQHLLAAILLVEQAPHLLDIIGDVGGLAAPGPGLGHQRLGLGFAGLCLGDVTVAEHLIDHPVAAVERGLVMEARIVIAGRARQRRQERHLRDVELVERLVEIVQRRGGDAVIALPQIDLVEVKLQHLFLRISGVDAHRQNGLAHLARHLEFGIEQEQARHLLGDGGSALRPAAFDHQPDILDRRQDHA